jgi:glycosyltransferase involved in cell wall biosynthesis
MEKELVSVVLPTYNRASCLERSIRSVLNQTWQDLELIIVDDGSTDHTQELVSSVEDQRICYVKTMINRGAGAARNYGIARAQGTYVAFQDSDDVWRPNKLELQIKTLQENDAGFCYHKVRYDFGNGQYAVLPLESIPLEKKSGDIYGQLFYENMVDAPALLVRRDCLEEVGGFDESLKALEDYDLAIRLAYAYQAAFVDQVLLNKGYTEGSVSLQAGNYLDASCEILLRYQKDYVDTGNFDRRVLRILEDAGQIGKKEHYLNVLTQGISIGS